MHKAMLSTPVSVYMAWCSGMKPSACFYYAVNELSSVEIH